MTITFKNILLIIALGFLAALLLVTSQTHASAPSGLPAAIATTSSPTVNTSAALVFASSTCSARIITTTASPIMIGFTDKQGFLPTGLVGHLQPASTTVAYDSGQYGCGAVRIYSFVSQNITVSESQ